MNRNKLRTIGERTRTVRPVQIACPRCEADSNARVVSVQRWFQVLGIPVARLSTREQRVQCDGCGHLASLAILDVPTAGQLAEWLTAAMRSTVATVVRAGGEYDPATCETAVDVMISAGHVYDRAMLDYDCAILVDDDTVMCLELLRDDLTSHGKQNLMHRMARIAQADGELTEPERRALVGIGVALGMAAPHINGIVTTAVRQRRVEVRTSS